MRTAQGGGTTSDSTERRWQQLIQNSSDAISVLGADGSVIFSSPVTERLFGHLWGERVGANMLDLVHPDDIPRAIEAFSSILERSGPSEPVEIRIMRADGSAAWVEAVTNNLLDDPDVAGIVVNTRDIGDRKQAETALLHSEQRWRRLFENSSDVITLIGADGTVISSTPGARFFDRPIEHIEGSNLVDFVHPDDIALAIETFEKIMANPGTSEPLEVRVVDARGDWHWIEGIANNLLDDPVVGAIVVNTRNVDERRRAEDALRASEERLRFIVEHSTDVISVVDDDGIVRYSSPAASSLPGYPLAGDPFVNGLCGLLDTDHGRAIARLRQQLASPGVHRPIRLKLSSGGQPRDIEVTVNNRLEDSSAPGVLVVARDITERETERHRRIMDELFADLVIGTVDSAHLSRAHAAGLLQASAYRAIVVPLEQEAPDGGESLPNEIARTIARLDAPGVVRGTFGGLGGLILPASSDAPTVARRLETALAGVVPAESVVVAVGAAKDGQTALKDALDDAIRILTLARRRGLHGTVHGDDVVVPALLASAPAIAEELAHMLRPLLQEDLRGRGELVETLRTYLAEGLSVHRAAQALVVHRNTARSRLKRIEALLGGGISELKLPLELALLAHDLEAQGRAGAS